MRLTNGHQNAGQRQHIKVGNCQSLCPHKRDGVSIRSKSRTRITDRVRRARGKPAFSPLSIEIRDKLTGVDPVGASGAPISPSTSL